MPDPSLSMVLLTLAASSTVRVVGALECYDCGMSSQTGKDECYGDEQTWPTCFVSEDAGSCVMMEFGKYNTCFT